MNIIVAEGFAEKVIMFPFYGLRFANTGAFIYDGLLTAFVFVQADFIC